MDIILLAITVVSLIVAFVMSVTAWRVTRDEKQRAAARVAALSLAAGDEVRPNPNPIGFEARLERPMTKAPWTPASFDAPDIAPARSNSLRTPPPIVAAATELPLNHAPRVEAAHSSEPTISHASGFLGAEETPRDTGSRQKSLAFAAVALFAVLSGGLVWMMSSPEGTSAAAVGPNSPLELVSLSHQRDKNKLAVSGLVRNPVAGHAVQNLSAVVFLFDRTGTFVTSSRANVDFLKLGPGDETPFVVSLDAPESVARYRVSFRTDDGVVPHVDRRVSSQESAVKSEVVSRQ